MQTRLLTTGSSSLLEHAATEAAALLLEGEIVALPTETVYGLAADATNATAVAKIFEAKERPLFDPLIVHLPSRDWLGKATAAQHHDPVVEALIDNYWPGPLTVVLPRTALIPDIVTSGLPTVAVRMSAHPVFLEIIGRTGRPLAAPSANRFGRISPTTGSHVRAELGGRIPLIVDAGPTPHGIESTIVLVENDTIRILRAGPITPEELSRFGKVIAGPRTGNLSVPGQLESHYAPRTRLLLVDHAPECAPETGRCALLAWNTVAQHSPFSPIEVLSQRGDLREAAANLFAALRRLDESGVDLIVAEHVPESGLGLAIMDRLRRAAGGE